MSMVQRDSSVSVRGARAAGEGFVDSRLFAILSRAGFVARALIYGIIGLLAFDLAIGQGGKITNQQGALRSVEQHPFGHLLLTLLAIGLGAVSSGGTRRGWSGGWSPRPGPASSRRGRSRSG